MILRKRAHDDIDLAMLDKILRRFPTEPRLRQAQEEIEPFRRVDRQAQISEVGKPLEKLCIGFAQRIFDQGIAL